MRKIKVLSIGFLVLISSVLLISWGYTGHYKISYNSSLSYFTQMSQFDYWAEFLADHASDADDRKEIDPNEAPKHYIDIDNYPEFIQNQSIPQTWDSIVAAHGSMWVYNMGILPWATMAAYDSLKNAMIQLNWNKAMLFAADLGHYVGDGHMPLHLTKNYDGQYTGNNGIHSRYESSMIYSYNSQIIYSGDTVKLIPSVKHYVFNYIYSNYKYKDSILLADNYAKSINSNTNSTAYKAALWEKTKKFTILLFKNASHSLAELIYNAWIEAGSPPVGVVSVDQYPDNLLTNFEIFPNPLSEKGFVEYKLSEDSPVYIKLYEQSGRIVRVLFQGDQNAGNYKTVFSTRDISPGYYFVEFNSARSRAVKKIVVVR